MLQRTISTIALTSKIECILSFDQQSVFEGSAWTWDEGRQAFYYHAFLESQPDLNYRNQAVRNKMKVSKYSTV